MNAQWIEWAPRMGVPIKGPRGPISGIRLRSGQEIITLKKPVRDAAELRQAIHRNGHFRRRFPSLPRDVSISVRYLSLRRVAPAKKNQIFDR